ncbi:CPBP family intramembrane glutamic endopeptidase [Sporosarcina sp. FA9]|uniref:CPBP family intramembrane glutamic endopeptidase n=1 Tax=Sporosarcina sp. FA9 TaxID=3413030 RepID=UPI003F6578E1
MFSEMRIRHLIGISLISILFGIVFFILPVSADFSITIPGLLFYITFIFYFNYQFKQQHVPVRKVVYTKGVGRWIPSIFGIVIVCIVFSLGTFWLILFSLNSIFPSIVDLILTTDALPSSPIFLGIEIIVIVILAPVIEEFIFRGVILHRLIKKTSITGGVLISSILFGVLHSDMIGAFFFGVITSLLFLKTGNLLIPILVHVLNNAIAVALTFISPTWPDWIHIIDRTDIIENAVPNLIMLAISSIFVGYIVFRLAKGLDPTRIKQLED